MKNLRARTLWALAATSLLASATAAETFTVHPMAGMGDFVSPAAALASSLVVGGDRIMVMPGTYPGTLVITKAVVLESMGGAGVTVLDGAGSGPVVEIAAGATVHGFTITGAGGSASVGGVLITSLEEATLEWNVIVENHPLGDEIIPTGGVLVADEAVAVLRRNDIRSNTAISVGGVFTSLESHVDMIGNHIRGNGPAIIGGVLLGGSTRLVNVQITGNKGIVGGLYVDAAIGPDPWGATIEITNCTIAGNLGMGTMPGTTIGGMFLDNGGGVTIRNSILHSNMGSPGGDLYISPDFLTAPTPGYIDLDYSHAGTIGAGIMPGPSMVPPFLPPGFVASLPAPFAPTALGDYSLTKVSANVDAGSDAAYPFDLPAIDLARKPRLHGSSVDIGAFELGARLLRSAHAPAGSPEPLGEF